MARRQRGRGVLAYLGRVQLAALGWHRATARGEPAWALCASVPEWRVWGSRGTPAFLCCTAHKILSLLLGALRGRLRASQAILQGQEESRWTL